MQPVSHPYDPRRSRPLANPIWRTRWDPALVEIIDLNASGGGAPEVHHVSPRLGSLERKVRPCHFAPATLSSQFTLGTRVQGPTGPARDCTEVVG